MSIIPNQSFAITIGIKDTTISRGNLDTIPIYANFDGLKYNEIKLFISFNAYLLEIHKVFGNEGTIIKDGLTFNIKLENLENAILEINSSNINTETNSEVLCYMVVEGLVYKDSICNIVPVNLYLDNIETEFIAQGGKVTIVGYNVIPTVKNFLGYPFPNPSSTQNWFYFGIEKNATVEFKIYNLNGQCIFDTDNSPNLFIASGKDKIYSFDEELPAGTYLLQVVFPNNIGEGIYYLKMQVLGTEFNSKFIIIK